MKMDKTRRPIDALPPVRVRPKQKSRVILPNDAKAQPPDKYAVLGNVLDWATNVGYPGYATAGIAEAFSTWVIPTMFAKVARGDESAEDAAKAAEVEYKRIFARWK